MSLLTNLNAYFKFDESSGNASDSTGNGNTLTNNGTATYSAAKINNGVVMLSSSSQYMQAVDSATTSVTGDFTLAGWISMTSQPALNGLMALINKSDVGAGGQRSYEMYYQDVAGVKKIYVGLFKDGGSTNFTDGTWTQTLTTATLMHVALVVTIANAAATKAEMYINGTTIGNWAGVDHGTGATAIFDGTARFTVGQFDPVLAGDYLNAQADELGLWSRVLTASEIALLYNGGTGRQYPFPGTSIQSSNLLTMGV